MMNGTVLDVAIGLVFVFVMLSAACSLLNERIQSILDKRSAMLQQTLRKLLDGVSAASAATASAASAANAGTAGAAAVAATAAIAAPAGDGASAATSPAQVSLFNRLTQHALIRGLSRSASQLPSYIPSSTFALALFDTIAPADGQSTLTFARLYDAVQALPASPGRDALLALLNAAQADLALARAHVERWFDHAMERLSGRYKRHINVWILTLGFGVALATNADAILLVQRLEHEQPLREAVAGEAVRVAQSTTPDAGGKPILVTEARVEQVEQLDLLFWDTHGTVREKDQASRPRAVRQPELTPSWLLWLWLKLIGFLITALAISVGAPFWFDLLGRLVNLRATGVKPAPAPAPAPQPKA